MASLQSGSFVVENVESIYSNLTGGTALVKSGMGYLQGLTVNTHTAGSIKLIDGLTSSGTVMHGTISFATGERFIPFHGEVFETGLFVLTSGTVNLTLQYR